jgi:hypothetical protein
VVRVLLWGGAIALALSAGSAFAAPQYRLVSSAVPAAGWIVIPAEASCRTEFELVGRSGAVTPVTMTSDGHVISLKVVKEGLAERAFLPLRIDQKRFSSLMLRTADPTVGELVLSEETEAALRKGSTLAVAWLGEEPLSVSLVGSEQGLTDLKVCGAQMAEQARVNAASAAQAKARAAAEAHAQALANAQLQTARAQQAAAEAERQRVEDAAERQRRAELDAERQRRMEAEAESRAYAQQQRQYQYDAEAARQRAYEEAQRRYYEPAPPPAWAPAWGYRRY